jgi:hypothetical protein
MNDVEAARGMELLFSDKAQMERIANPEIAGGRIALIAANNNPVQVPPSTLDHMHASLQKQKAFNRRVLQAEEQIAGINSGLADFLQGMSMDPAEPVFVCRSRPHNARESTSRR